MQCPIIVEVQLFDAAALRNFHRRDLRHASAESEFD
jgi:hypothetical protein